MAEEKTEEKPKVCPFNVRVDSERGYVTSLACEDCRLYVDMKIGDAAVLGVTKSQKFCAYTALLIAMASLQTSLAQSLAAMSQMSQRGQGIIRGGPFSGPRG